MRIYRQKSIIRPKPKQNNIENYYELYEDIPAGMTGFYCISCGHFGRDITLNKIIGFCVNTPRLCEFSNQYLGKRV